MGKNKKLNYEELLFLLFLGIPSLGLALTYTFVTTYLPFFLEKKSNAPITGLIISIEGFFALTIPIVIGVWSDSIKSPLGNRLPFCFAGAVLSSLSLALMPFSLNYLSLMAIELAVFMIGYFTVYEAYFTIYTDQIPSNERGRSQGIMGGFRSLGMLIAMSIGGFLINVWQPLPFLLFMVILIVVTVILYFTIRNRLKVKSTKISQEGFDWKNAWKLIKTKEEIKLWIIANTLWEAAVSILRIFIVLYFIKGLKLNFNQSSEALGLVGLSALVAAPLSGFLADKYGHKPVVLTSILLFAIGLSPPIFTANKYFLIGILPVAFAAVVLMTLPFSMLMNYLPNDKQHGAGSALFGFCQGLGVVIGAITGGIAVYLTQDFDFLAFKETEGYSAIYIISAIYLFISFPFSLKLFKLKKETKKE